MKRVVGLDWAAPRGSVISTYYCVNTSKNNIRLCCWRNKWTFTYGTLQAEISIVKYRYRSVPQFGLYRRQRLEIVCKEKQQQKKGKEISKHPTENISLLDRASTLTSRCREFLSFFLFSSFVVSSVVTFSNGLSSFIVSGFVCSSLFAFNFVSDLVTASSQVVRTLFAVERSLSVVSSSSKFGIGDIGLDVLFGAKNAT